ADGRGIVLAGADGQPGLAGGEAPEREAFTVRFLGSDKPRAYRASVRIVTQAMNRGQLSRAQEGEPPMNLYYVDLPVTATVR
nr:hypothetical protein [Planctomycetota bacterium]